MNITKATRRRWKRQRPEIEKQFKEAKKQLTVFAHPANREESESYYQYWRGVRNALLWVLYNHPPINSAEGWETWPREEEIQ